MSVPALPAMPAMHAPASDTFQIRVRNAFHGKYQPYMRRSLQSIALWEAHRSLETQYPHLQPFQRKYALFATAVALLKTLDFLDYDQRQEVMFRTVTSREPIPADVAWKRRKLLERDILSHILPLARKLRAADTAAGVTKTHDELCAAVLQSMWDANREGRKRVPYPATWEFKKHFTFSIYRVYWRGVVPDPDIFPAAPPRVVEVAQGTPLPEVDPPDPNRPPPAAAAPKATAADLKAQAVVRRRALAEIVRHMQVLEGYAGIVPAAEVVSRKRALYALLPPVPPPFEEGGKKKRGRRAASATIPSPAAAALAPPPTVEEDWEKALKAEAAVEC